MIKKALIWERNRLVEDAEKSEAIFRASRLQMGDEWKSHFVASYEKFTLLLKILDNLQRTEIPMHTLVELYNAGLGEALRYLAGPPFSDDDLCVIADVPSLKSSIITKDSVKLSRVFSIIMQSLDIYRFPWVGAQRPPTSAELASAILASSTLLAAQRIATNRRSDGKEKQEQAVKSYLTSIGLTEVPPVAINTIVKGPGSLQFCGECQLGERKADIVIRLHDTRLLALECKVSNSSTNSVKRLNNDAAVKADYWLKTFGTSQVVPSAVLAGVFNVLNLEQAQSRGLTLFWSHDISELGHFIRATEQQQNK
jgi:hypothetical protein